MAYSKEELVENPKVVRIPAIAERFEVAESTVRDPRWRKRVNLRLVKIGGRVLGALEQDLDALVIASREQLAK